MRNVFEQILLGFGALIHSFLYGTLGFFEGSYSFVSDPKVAIVLMVDTALVISLLF